MTANHVQTDNSWLLHDTNLHKLHHLEQICSHLGTHRYKSLACFDTAVVQSSCAHLEYTRLYLDGGEQCIVSVRLFTGALGGCRQSVK